MEAPARGHYGVGVEIDLRRSCTNRVMVVARQRVNSWRVATRVGLDLDGPTQPLLYDFGLLRTLALLVTVHNCETIVEATCASLHKSVLSVPSNTAAFADNRTWSGASRST